MADSNQTKTPGENRFQQGLEKVYQVLEGPSFMRVASAAAGVALAAGTLYDCLRNHMKNILLDTPSLLLRSYVIMFGLIIALNELKSVESEKFEEWRQMVFKWMPFLSVAAGKGLFMILTSSVGLAFNSSISVWGPSAVIFALGAFYVFYYVYDKKEQDNAISTSMSYTPLSKQDPSAWL